MELTQQEVLNMPFDIERHKATFIDYFETVIAPDGTVYYANPSHQEKLIALAMEKRSMTRGELMDNCPPEYYADFMNWLIQITGYIPVWNEFFLGAATPKQLASLKKLKLSGVYRGSCNNQTNGGSYDNR